MSMKNSGVTEFIPRVVDDLLNMGKNEKLLYCTADGQQMPSGKIVSEIIELVRTIIFPGYYGEPTRNDTTLSYRLGVNIEKLYIKLSSQIYAAYCFCHDQHSSDERMKIAYDSATAFVEYLPELRRKMAMDVIATYNGDPAATCCGEVISCYPTVKAVVNYRMAHKLYELSVPLLPRMITEQAHSETGIDIHPGACIGDYFSIDHGTGVVIGETCVIGNNVKLYQGVTLGAKSFPLDENGHPIKGIPRHPIIGNNVIVYSNATVLGRVTVGDGAVIGGNVWVTEDVPCGVQVVQKK